jgi:hypothetical protein
LSPEIKSTEEWTALIYKSNFLPHVGHFLGEISQLDKEELKEFNFIPIFKFMYLKEDFSSFSVFSQQNMNVIFSHSPNGDKYLQNDMVGQKRIRPLTPPIVKTITSPYNGKRSSFNPVPQRGVSAFKDLNKTFSEVKNK